MKDKKQAAIEVIESLIFDSSMDIYALNQVKDKIENLGDAIDEVVYEKTRKPRRAQRGQPTKADRILEKLGPKFSIEDFRKVAGKKNSGIMAAQLTRKGAMRKLKDGTYVKVAAKAEASAKAA